MLVCGIKGTWMHWGLELGQGSSDLGREESQPLSLKAPTDL